MVSRLNRLFILMLCCLCICVVLPSTASLAYAKQSNTANHTEAIRQMLSERGYSIERIKVIVIGGQRVLDVDARRGKERINFKISEATLQIISQTRY